MVQATKKTFDAVLAKRKAQAAIYAETKDLTHQQEIEYLNRKVETGPFADWWRKVREATRQRREASQK